MTGNDPTKQYEDMVEAWVFGALMQGCRTLAELLTALPGVYPTVALDALERLLSAQKVNPQIATKIISEARQSVSPWRIRLPVPHPLDYDWRFDENAIRRLVSLCLKATPPGDTIALLGTPSVFSAVIDMVALRQVMLIDSNATMISALTEAFPASTIQRCDLLQDSLPDCTAATLVLDPPWYEEHCLTFLWAASRLCSLHGKILVSLPPLGTRPGMTQERAALFEYADTLGLVLDCLEPSALPYVIPPFEINALKTAGIFGVDDNWRRGDLAIFTKAGITEAARPHVTRIEDGSWCEHSIGEVRIRVRQTEENIFASPVLISMVDGDVFPTVSRRDPRRSMVDVWTSGNRVFACRGCHVLRWILNAMVKGKMPETEVADCLERSLTEEQRSFVRKAAEQISSLVEQEQREYRNWGRNNATLALNAE